MIIAICGFQGAGKDTLADILVKKHNFTKLAFGSAVKDVVSSLFQWDREMLEGITKESREQRETIDEWWSDILKIDNFTPRKAMQLIGTDLFRHKFNSDIWVYIVEKKIIELIKEKKNIVVCDCRFPNELEMLKKYDVKLIHIYRQIPIWFNDYKNGIEVEEMEKIHISEKYWMRFTFHYEINNNETIELLENKIDMII